MERVDEKLKNEKTSRKLLDALIRQITRTRAELFAKHRLELESEVKEIDTSAAEPATVASPDVERSEDLDVIDRSRLATTIEEEQGDEEDVADGGEETVDE